LTFVVHVIIIAPMSIKRTKQVSRTPRNRDSEDAPRFSVPKPTKPKYTWEEHVAKAPEDAFKPYSLKGSFEETNLVLHPVFGKGIVINAEERRIEVLFKEGPKKLGHNM
jgi:hypothetical protein